MSAEAPLDADARARVDTAVAAAEKWTAAAVVPVVAARVELGGEAIALGGLGALAAGALLLPFAPHAWLLPLAAAAGALAGPLWARRYPALGLWLVPAATRAARRRAAAQRALHDRRIVTADGPALILWVSLPERRAAVAANTALEAALGAPFLGELEAALDAALAQRSVDAALGAAIERAGARLEPALPRRATALDEPPHTLVVL